MRVPTLVLFTLRSSRGSFGVPKLRRSSLISSRGALKGARSGTPTICNRLRGPLECASWDDGLRERVQGGTSGACVDTAALSMLVSMDHWGARARAIVSAAISGGTKGARTGIALSALDSEDYWGAQDQTIVSASISGGTKGACTGTAPPATRLGGRLACTSSHDRLRECV